MQGAKINVAYYYIVVSRIYSSVLILWGFEGWSCKFVGCPNSSESFFCGSFGGSELLQTESRETRYGQKKLRNALSLITRVLLISLLSRKLLPQNILTQKSYENVGLCNEKVRSGPHCLDTIRGLLSYPFNLLCSGCATMRWVHAKSRIQRYL